MPPFAALALALTLAVPPPPPPPRAPATGPAAAAGTTDAAALPTGTTAPRPLPPPPPRQAARDAGVAPAKTPAAARPTVVVLPFENLTAAKDYDLLPKGLADMMVTDLVASGAVDVVERARLHAIVQELELQRRGGFDPATVQRLGKLVGATHAVTGAVQEVKDSLRLSVRVVALSSGAVVAAQEVVGPVDRLFDLQQQLVTLLLGAMNVSLGTALPARGALSVETLLSYSRAVDAADEGDLLVASARIAEVLKRSPGFSLGRDRKVEWARRLRAAGDTRKAQREAVRRQLLGRTTAVLTGARPLVSMGDLEAARHLTYRVLRHEVLALGLLAQLTPTPMHNVPEGGAPGVRGSVAALLENLGFLEQELAAWKGTWRWLPDPDDKAALDTLGLVGPPDGLAANVPGGARRVMGLLALAGEVDVGGGVTFAFRPTPGETDPALVDRAAAWLLDAAQALGGSTAKDAKERGLALLDARALGLSRCGRKEEAVKAWQGLLESAPQSKRYALVEQHLKDALELSPEAVAFAEKERTLADALARCAGPEVQAALPDVLSHHFEEDGLWGVRPVVTELEGQCRDVPAFAPTRRGAWQQAAAFAARHGDCGWFEVLAARLAAEDAKAEKALRAATPACQ